jgi:hypothetical protein
LIQAIGAIGFFIFDNLFLGKIACNNLSGKWCFPNEDNWQGLAIAVNLVILIDRIFNKPLRLCGRKEALSINNQHVVLRQDGKFILLINNKWRTNSHHGCWNVLFVFIIDAVIGASLSYYIAERYILKTQEDENSY